METLELEISPLYQNYGISPSQGRRLRMCGIYIHIISTISALLCCIYKKAFQPWIDI